MRGQARFFKYAGDRGVDVIWGAASIQRLHELPEHASVAEGPVAIAHRQLVPLDQRIQAMPARVGIETPRQLDGAKHLRAEAAPELVLEKAVIETGVVGDENATCDAFLHVVSDPLEGWRVCDHGVGDSGHRLYRAGDAAFGIHQRAPFLHVGAAVDAHDTDFGDPIRGGRHAVPALAPGVQVDAVAPGREVDVAAVADALREDRRGERAQKQDIRVEHRPRPDFQSGQVVAKLHHLRDSRVERHRVEYLLVCCDLAR